jgi:lipoprotein-anchoring transpeptidase ErfK/SrfK
MLRYGKWLALGVGGVIAVTAAAVEVPRVTRDAEGTVAAEASAAGLSLSVDISERKLYVMQGDESINSYTVTVGTAKHPTPRGSFGVRRIVWNPRWVPPDAAWARDKKPRNPGDPKNPMGKVKMYFNEPDYYIHGTLSTSELGTAASHGCIRMSNPDAVELARLLMDRGGAQVPPGFFERVLGRVRATKSVRLEQAIPLRISG